MVVLRRATGADAAALISGLAAGITVVAVERRGGFYRPDYIVLPAVLAAAALTVVRRLSGRERAVVVSLGAFVAWWLVAGYAWGAPTRAWQLAGSVVGFGAAFTI